MFNSIIFFDVGILACCRYIVFNSKSLFVILKKASPIGRGFLHYGLKPNVNDFKTFDEFNKAFDEYEASFGEYDNPSDQRVIEKVENPAARKLRQPTRKAHSYKRKFKAKKPFSTKEKK